jgi:hypothetical protein
MLVLGKRRNTLITEKAANPGRQERYESVAGYDSNEESYNITTILPCLYISSSNIDYNT